MEFGEKRQKLRETIKAEGKRTDLEIEQEVLKMCPDRDFDDEELDEIGKWEKKHTDRSFENNKSSVIYKVHVYKYIKGREILHSITAANDYF